MATTNTRKTAGKYAKTKNTTSKALTAPVSTQTNSTTRRRRRTTKKRVTFESIYNNIDKKDVKWYWDLKKWSPIIIIMLLIVYVTGCNNGKAKQISIFETMPPETIYVEVTEAAIIPEETEAKLDDEAVALAILADTSASGKTDTVKRILMWVAINRVEDRSNGYGGSLIEEINRPKQWQQYNPKGMYLQSTYDIALEVLTTWRDNGPRPIYNDMLWSVYNRDGSITVRNKFSGDKGRNEQTFE